MKTMKNRSDLPAFLNEHGLTGHAAEIGVRSGRNARTILDTWRGQRLYVVDSWRPLPNYNDPANVTQAEHDRRYLSTLELLKIHRSRVRILRMLSCEAAELIEDGELDGLHVDALHTHEGVKRDLHIWWPKLRVGGLFSGHDYYNGTAEPKTHNPVINNALPSRLVPYGVKGAVDEFAKMVGATVQVTTHDQFPTWWWIK